MYIDILLIIAIFLCVNVGTQTWKGKLTKWINKKEFTYFTYYSFQFDLQFSSVFAVCP